MDFNDCVHDFLSESAGTDEEVVRHWDIDAVCIHEIDVRSRCGDSSTPQDTDFNDCVHEELDVDDVLSLMLVRSLFGDSSTPHDTDCNECVHEDSGY